MTEWNAAEYAQRSGLQGAMAEEVLALLDLEGPERVLDVGCGDGKITAARCRSCFRRLHALQALPCGRRTAQYWNSPIRAPSGNTHRFSPTCCTASKIGEPARSGTGGRVSSSGPISTSDVSSHQLPASR
jgi:hypothetical protein